MILQASHLTYEIKDRVLLDIDHIEIHQDDRIGLVGPNGSGKTTLLEILAQKKQGQHGGNVTTFGNCELIPQLKETNMRASGGEITQAAIDEALGLEPNVLLADEPTANLDTMHVQQLEKVLSNWNGALVMVSHDRMFLDTLCTTIWELRDGKLLTYKGNYSEYAAHRKREEKRQMVAYEQYKRKKKQLEEAQILKEQKAQRAIKKPKGVSNLEARKSKMYYANKQKKLHQSASALETRLEHLNKVDKVYDESPIKMSLPHESVFKNKIMVRVMNLQGQVDDRLLWKPVTFDVRGGDKVALIGANGSGKTTLLKRIINNHERIRISRSVKIGYFSQHVDHLELEKTVLDNVQSTAIQDETTVRTVLARLRFKDDDVYKKIEDLSGGERVKVAFATLFVSDINTLILDEPTNFLDIEAVEAFEKLLQQYEGTILFTSHDRQFIQSVATRILSIEDQEMHVFEGTYKQFKQAGQVLAPDEKREKRLLLETKITEVLSKLSIEPSEELDADFNALLAEKKKLDE